MTVRQDLRAQVIEISGGRCEFPDCSEAGRELAHLHSVGAGGRKSADVLGNVMFACRPHARLTDGEYHDGAWYLEEHQKLWVAAGWEGHVIFESNLAFERAEALAEYLRVVRGGKGIMA